MPVGDSVSGSPKGKQATKGQKQIVEENKSTLDFYIKGIVAVNLIFMVLTFLFFWESFTTFYMVLYVFLLLAYFGAYKFMSSMGKATYDASSGVLMDGGIDLNMESGMAEHCKDLLILMAIVQLLSLLSNYFWLGLLMAPGRAFYLLWVNILSPWFFAPPPEVDEKKQKKMERRMKRQR